jgi:leucyl aminopeptidase (aminopeptidase T)
MMPVATEDLTHAARALVTSALKLRDRERFVIICDAASARIARALEHAAGANVLTTVCDLDQLESITSATRPHRTMPDPLRQALEMAQASVFVASAPHGEATMREELLHRVAVTASRHAHMPGTSELGFARALKVDCDKLAQTSMGLLRQLDFARTLDAESSVGTHLSITFDSHTRWLACVGVIEPGTWTSFPTGTLYAPTFAVDGVFVANASLGEFFGERERLLLEHPVRFTIEGGLVTNVEAPHAPSLKEDIVSMLSVAANSNRVGVVAIGLNSGIDTPIGEAQVDITMPSLHLVIGDPAGKAPNPTFSARTSFAACSAGTSVKVDGKPIRLS